MGLGFTFLYHWTAMVITYNNKNTHHTIWAHSLNSGTPKKMKEVRFGAHELD